MPMFDLAFLLAPTFAMFFLGVLLRRTSVLDDRDADTLLKLVFNLTLPALLLSVLPSVELNSKLLLVALISTLIILLTLPAAMLAGKVTGMKPQTSAVLVSGSIIMNLGFVMPFVQSFYGDEGLARLFIFDIPNGVSAYTIAWAFACRSGSNPQHCLNGKLFKSPPLLALALALFMNALSLRPEPLTAKILLTTGTLTIPLVLLALGASFSIKKANPLHLGVGIALRMLLGLSLGLWLTDLLNISGVDRAVVVLCASAPAGFNTLTFASVEKLDREFAATLVAACMIASMVLIPILLTTL
ncbi:AEC family transporter [Chlorobium ferrooxidans]|uniref:Auxin Efflux Carrier n=1 Tax=Chlorobium ferrooxidans DSM 13031 TaxID=377431 RepID=Q0YRJ9_9CHLB|nr:AEC family transporter [Chlorobium ferrooxidans]EAT58895.1 Auxin Efflux Carrier [Chlorobium ferrooxidans DSM 13031]